jgi:hypothetical protein
MKEQDKSDEFAANSRSSVGKITAKQARMITGKSNTDDFYLRIAYKSVIVFALGKHSEIRTDLTDNGINAMTDAGFKVVKLQLISEEEMLYSCKVSW